MREEWFEDVAQMGAPDPGFATRAELASMTTAARRRFDVARRRFLKSGPMINTKIAKGAFDIIINALEADQTGASDSNDMLLLSGPAGVGKSKVASTVAVFWYYECIYAEADRTGEDPNALMESLDFVPVVRITLPGAVTPRELFALICEFLDVPIAVTHTDLRRAAEHALVNAGTRLLLVDEVQSLRFEGKSSRDTHSTLRHFVNISGLTLLAVGHKMVEILDKPLDDDQAEKTREMLCERMSSVEIGPFLHGNQERWDEWIALLDHLEGRFRLADAEPGWLSEPALAAYVYQVTLGSFKPLISLLSRANSYAISQGLERVDRELLSGVLVERAKAKNRDRRVAMLDSGQWKFIDPFGE